MTALIAVIAALLPSVELAGVSLKTWITIAGALVAAEPQIKTAVVDLHPVFSQIVTDLNSGKTPEEAGANAANSIPGYASDGSVTEISAS